MAFVATKRVVVGADPVLDRNGDPVLDASGVPLLERRYREPGEMCPEAAEWPNIDVAIRTGQVAYVPDSLATTDDLTALRAELDALREEVANLRSLLKNKPQQQAPSKTSTQ